MKIIACLLGVLLFELPGWKTVTAQAIDTRVDSSKISDWLVQETPVHLLDTPQVTPLPPAQEEFSFEGTVVFALTDGGQFINRNRMRFGIKLPEAGGVLEFELGNGNGAISEVAKTSALYSDLGYEGVEPELKLNGVVYTQRMGKEFSVSVYPLGSVGDYVDLVDNASSSTKDFSTDFFGYNPVLLAGDTGQAGIAFEARLTECWYSRGGFNTLQGGSLGVLELEYRADDVALRFQVSHGTAEQEPYTAVGFSFNASAFFGRIGYALQTSPRVFETGQQSAENPFTWMVGAAFPRFLGSQATFAIAVGQPPHSGSPGTQTNFEALVRIPVTGSVTITPGLQFITNPGNQEGQSIIQFYNRLVLKF